MSKINKSGSNSVYNFSFSLKVTNPFEKAMLDKLNELIENGCSKKEAIMTLMAKNVMDNFNLDASISESVHFQKEQVVKDKIIMGRNIEMPEEVEVIEDNQIEFINKKMNQNQQVKIVESEQKQANNETTKKLSDDKKKKLQAILEGVYKYRE